MRVEAKFDLNTLRVDGEIFEPEFLKDSQNVWNMKKRALDQTVVDETQKVQFLNMICFLLNCHLPIRAVFI